MLEGGLTRARATFNQQVEPDSGDRIDMMNWWLDLLSAANKAWEASGVTTRAYISSQTWASTARLKEPASVWGRF